MNNPEAFPRTGYSDLNEGRGTANSHKGESGMTLLDYFASKAMNGLIADGYTLPDSIARKSFEIAHAMLKERLRLKK